jgi:hypothetical protein
MPRKLISDCEAEINRLAEENEALKGELASMRAEEAREVVRSALQAKTPAKPRMPESKGTTVSFPKTGSTLIAPSDAEMLALGDIGIAAFPEFGPAFELSFTERLTLSRNPQADIRPDRAGILTAWRKQFRLAFIAAGSFFRTVEPNRRQYCGHWTDCANSWLRSFGLRGDVETTVFILACICHGDIQWTDGRINGSVFELALDTYTGKPAGDAWRNVLQTGKLRPATPVPSNRRMATASPVRVY